MKDKEKEKARLDKLEKAAIQLGENMKTFVPRARKAGLSESAIKKFMRDFRTLEEMVWSEVTEDRPKN